MNLKAFFLLAILAFSFAAQANPDIYMLKSGQAVALQNINHSEGTAYYFDFENSKRIYINLEDAYPQVKESRGLSKGQYVSVQLEGEQKLCLTHYVFANESAYFGCQVKRFSTFENDYVTKLENFTSSIDNLLVEVKSIDGFTKNEQVRFEGKNYAIVALFENGQVLLKRVGILSRIFDSKLPLTSPDSRSVTTRDIEKL